MDANYEQLQAVLRERGYTTRWEVVGSSGHLVVELEAPSQLDIIDLFGLGNGWCLQHITLSESCSTMLYQDSTYDVAAMVSAINEFVAHRNREHLADELVQALEEWLCTEGYEARTYSDGTGTWVTVWSHLHEYDFLMVTSYPNPGQGVNTDGTMATGWSVRVQRTGEEPPYRVLYDAPGTANVRPLIDTIDNWMCGRSR